MDLARRNVLKGRIRTPARVPLRPPWAQPEPTFLETCSRCNACLDACAEKIVMRGEGGFPAIDFSHRECTFCYACARACPSGALGTPGTGPPWKYVARISTACLSAQGVYCRSCGEVCEVDAIRFTLALGSVPRPRVNTQDCSGCGACVGVCPAGAVEVIHG